MNRDKVIAHVLMEEMSEPMPVNNLREYKENGLLYVKFDTVLQSFNVKNRNKRIYDGDAILESLAADHVQELIREGSFVSEYGHPLDQQMSRVSQIDPARICGRINSYYRTGNILRGEFESFDDGALGTVLTRRILQKMNPAFSLRAIAPLHVNKNGDKVMKSKAHIVAFDVVVLPSHKEAYRDKTKELQICRESMEIDLKNATRDEVVFALNESMITEFIKDESKNVKLIQNVCEVIPESIKVTPDLKNIILKEGSNTFYVKTEDKIKQDIQNFLSRF